jgi:hypothetical protein
MKQESSVGEDVTALTPSKGKPTGAVNVLPAAPNHPLPRTKPRGRSQ